MRRLAMLIILVGFTASSAMTQVRLIKVRPYAIFCHTSVQAFVISHTWKHSGHEELAGALNHYIDKFRAGREQPCSVTNDWGDFTELKPLAIDVRAREGEWEALHISLVLMDSKILFGLSNQPFDEWSIVRLDE